MWSELGRNIYLGRSVNNMALSVLTKNDWHNVTFLKLDSSFLTPFQTSMEEERNKTEIQTVKHGFFLNRKKYE